MTLHRMAAAAESWNPLGIAESAAEEERARFLQSDFWAEFKAGHGWRHRRFEFGAASARFSASVLVRDFAVLGLRFSLAYVPLAPECPPDMPAEDYGALLLAFARALRSYMPRNTLCVRIDPPVDCAELAGRSACVAAYSRFIKKAAVDVQPPDTVLLDLSPSSDALLAAMKPKWRYNIRLAQRKGVSVTAYRAGSSTEQELVSALDVFYGLYETTAMRDGIAIHAREYYLDLLRRSDARNCVTLYIARHEDDNLAAIITLFCAREAVYLYGASGNVKRNLMPAYLLQWTAINDARSFGSAVYDFYGMPPTDDESHPMHGLYLFKTGFGGRVVHRPGSFDVPASPLYGLYAAAEKARAFWHKRIKKLLAGR